MITSVTHTPTHTRVWGVFRDTHTTHNRPHSHSSVSNPNPLSSKCSETRITVQTPCTCKKHQHTSKNIKDSQNPQHNTLKSNPSTLTPETCAKHLTNKETPSRNNRKCHKRHTHAHQNTHRSHAQTCVHAHKNTPTHTNTHKHTQTRKRSNTRTHTR